MGKEAKMIHGAYRGKIFAKGIGNQNQQSKGKSESTIKK